MKYASCNLGIHDFQPRYDEVRKQFLFLSVLVSRTYIKDVCTGCGKEVTGDER